MNSRQHLNIAVANLTGESLAQSARNVDAVLKSIHDLSKDGLQLRNYGKFSIKHTAERLVNHPGTSDGTKVVVPASDRMVFKASKSL